MSSQSVLDLLVALASLAAAITAGWAALTARQAFQAQIVKQDTDNVLQTRDTTFSETRQFLKRAGAIL